jgi:hypothetical protein
MSKARAHGEQPRLFASQRADRFRLIRTGSGESDGRVFHARRLRDFSRDNWMRAREPSDPLCMRLPINSNREMGGCTRCAPFLAAAVNVRQK